MVLVTKKQKPLPIHHQKRHGSHHKHTKPYEKTYWPYLPLFAIIGFSFIINFVWTGLSASKANVLGASDGITQDALLLETNKDRHADNAGSMTLDNQLTAAAQAKAQDMANKDYWSHIAPDGTTPWRFIKQTGYQYRAAGENLAYGFANSDQVIRGWMNSREHRTNLLNSAYSNVGFGVVEAPSYQGKAKQTIVVAMYGQPTTDVGFTPSLTGNDLPSKQVVRLDLFAGNAVPGALYMLITVATVAASVVIIRHFKFAHRAFAYSEDFIIHHPMIDVAMVGLVAAGIVLSRTTGFIH